MDKITGLDCNDEGPEWNVASTSSLSTSNTLNKSKYTDQGDALNCATPTYIHSDMIMKEIHSNGDIKDENSNNDVIAANTTVNSVNDNLEYMDDDPIDVNSSLSPSSLIYSNNNINKNAAIDVQNVSTTSQVLITPSLASIAADDLLSRQTGITLAKKQDGDKCDNTELIDSSNLSAMNDSLMEHDRIEEDENGPLESESDERQMPNMNNLAEALVLLSMPIATNRHDENDRDGRHISNGIAPTFSGMINGIGNNVGEIDLPLPTVSSISRYIQDEETIASSLNPLNSVEGLHDNTNLEEEQLMMNAAGIQRNYPLVLVRRLSQAEVNQVQTNACVTASDSTERALGDEGRVRDRGRQQRDSLESVAVVAGPNERAEDRAALVHEVGSISTQRENLFQMAEGENNEAGDDDEEMHDGDVTPVYVSDGVSSSSLVEIENADDDGIDNEDESDSSQEATERGLNNGDRRRASRTNNAYDIEYDSLRELILRTRRSMNEEAASSSSSSTSNFELAPRDSFMQRFRRILFILSSRRRRLIRLGLASPDTENPESEAGAGAGAGAGGGADDAVGSGADDAVGSGADDAVGSGADDAVGSGAADGAGADTNADAELSPDNSSNVLHQIADRLSLDFNIDYNDLDQSTRLFLAQGARTNDNAQGGGGTSAAELDILPENAVRFDTNLPAEHSYMGNNMNRVCGVNYLDVGQQYNNIMLFMHHALLFPGEILPFMISGSIISDDIDRQNGFLFGVCFPFLNDNTNSDNIYGVTCQIYEKGTNDRGNTLIKSRALQRFVTKTNEFIGPLEYISDHPQMKCYGNVKILPDIYLPEPLKCIPMGSLSRFRDTENMQEVYKRYQVAGLPWPAHIYDYYGITAIIEKARTQLAQHKIDTMPTDPIQLSYWLVRNLHLSENLMHSIFLTNSVNVRLELISRTFKEESIFSCRYCSSHIANCRELFAMSKHGVQTQYCNSAGYIHETNTLYQVNMDAILYSGAPSTEFSWFPGYQWHVIVCKICTQHLGWEFRAVKPNLVPKQFYGISSSGIRIRSAQSVRDNARIRSIIRFHSARAMILEEGGSGSESNSGGANADGTAAADIDNNDDNNDMQLGDDADADIERDGNSDAGDGDGGSVDGGFPSLD